MWVNRYRLWEVQAGSSKGAHIDGQERCEEEEGVRGGSESV